VLTFAASATWPIVSLFIALPPPFINNKPRTMVPGQAINCPKKKTSPSNWWLSSNEPRCWKRWIRRSKGT